MNNIFVLCTGRSGSTTFVRAASHINNYTAGHETRAALVGTERLAYPAHHIEADNRLSWILGRLETRYGERAKYVHLIRDPAEVATSFERRWNMRSSIIWAYRKSILLEAPEDDRSAVCNDYVDTVTQNIRLFLRDKPDHMEFHLENAVSDWRKFWKWAEAQGDLNASLREWSVAHNASKKGGDRESGLYRKIRNILAAPQR